MFPILLVVVCLLLYRVWSQRSKEPHPPLYPHSLPIIGHAHHVWGDRVTIWKNLQRIINYSLQQDGVALVYTGTYKVYIVTNPDDCAVIFNACLNRPYIFNFIKQWLGIGLISTEPPFWKPIRKAIRPILTQRYVTDNIGAFNNHSRRLVKGFREQVGKGMFVPGTYLAVHALQTLLESTFGLENGNDSSTDLAYCEAVEHLINLFYKRIMNPLIHFTFTYNLTSLKKEIDGTIKLIESITKKNIENRTSELKKMGNTEDYGQSKIFFDALMKLTNKEKYFSLEEMGNHMDTLLLAGFDTSSKVMSYLMPLIGSHPKVQERLIEELQEVLGDSDRDLDKHDLNKLDYMEAVIKETIRLYPPVPIIGRTANAKVKLRNYTIPVGGMFAIAVYGMHRHPVWGPNAGEFRPERWLEPGGVPENTNANAGFGVGARSCLGKTYALTFLKITMAHLLRNYRITADVSKLVLEINTFLKPISGHEIELELRTVT